MLNRCPNLTYVVVVVVVFVVVVVLVELFMMLMKWLPTVIIMVQIVNIFCFPPHLFFYIISVSIKNYTNFYFSVFSVSHVFTKGIGAI